MCPCSLHVRFTSQLSDEDIDRLVQEFKASRAAAAAASSVGSPRPGTPRAVAAAAAAATPDRGGGEKGVTDTDALIAAVEEDINRDLSRTDEEVLKTEASLVAQGIKTVRKELFSPHNSHLRTSLFSRPSTAWGARGSSAGAGGAGAGAGAAAVGASSASGGQSSPRRPRTAQSRRGSLQMQWEAFEQQSQPKKAAARLPSNPAANALADSATRKLVLVGAVVCVTSFVGLRLCVLVGGWVGTWNKVWLTWSAFVVVVCFKQSQSKMDLRPTAVAEAVSLTHGSTVVVAGNLVRSLRRRRTGREEEVRFDMCERVGGASLPVCLSICGSARMRCECDVNVCTCTVCSRP